MDLTPDMTTTLETTVESVKQLKNNTWFANRSFDNASEEFDIDAYLVSFMGERRRDLPSVLVLTVVYVLIFIAGVAGNICTCIVIAKNSYMHTATNYYLFSLAVSDMFTLLFGLQQTGLIAETTGTCDEENQVVNNVNTLQRCPELGQVKQVPICRMLDLTVPVVDVLGVTAALLPWINYIKQILRTFHGEVNS